MHKEVSAISLFSARLTNEKISLWQIATCKKITRIPTNLATAAIFIVIKTAKSLQTFPASILAKVSEKLQVSSLHYTIDRSRNIRRSGRRRAAKH